MIDQRILILTVSSIFLALGIGIAVGTALPGEEVLLEERNALIAQLEGEFTRIRGENASLRTRVRDLEAQLKAAEDFQRRVIESVVANALVGVNLGIVEHGSGETTRGVVEDLRRWGADLAWQVTLDPRALDERQLEHWAELLRTEGRGVKEIMAGVTAYVLEGLLGDSRPALTGGAVTVEGRAAGVDAILVLAEPSADPVVLGAVLAAVREAAGEGLPVIVGEASSGAAGLGQVGGRLGLAVVDNVDQPLGRFSLVALLLGAEWGHYGVKAGARAPLPWGFLEDALEPLVGR